MTVLRARHILLGLLLGMLANGAAHAASATRTSAFEYDPATGLLTKEIVEPDIPSMRLDTAYTYDAWGNKTAATVSSPATGLAAIAPRGSSNAYDARGQFPTSSTNALNQSETKVIEPKFGNIASLTGPNGLTTQWQYDSFGRKTREIRADGLQTQWEYLFCNGVNGGTATCPSTAKYLVRVTPLATDGVTANGSWTKAYYDLLDREIKAETQGFDGTSVITKDTEYDSLGRVYRVSNPYYAGQTVLWTTPTYDALGRVVATALPDNSQTTSAYNGLTAVVTNSLSQTQTKIKNSQGQLIQVADAQNNSLTYQYDPFGNLTKTTDPMGNNTTLVYDQRGRKIQMIDPGMGTWNYVYNALGELVRQTDAKNQVTNLVYDLLGRMTSRAEPDLISTWTFDSCTKGIGKPCTATADNGYSRSHSYDSLGRATSTTTTIDATYTASATFDANGRLATQTYPTGFAVKYVYTSLGYLKEVRNNQTNALFWRADTLDAQGHLLQQTYGNGVVTQQVYQATTGRLTNIYAGAGNAVQNLTYTYDSLGNLQSRNDATQTLSETFLYDSLNRVTTATVNSGGAGLVTQTFAYNAIGNITSRSDVGAYTYGTVNNRPHAVTEVQLAAGGKRQYSYDANGSLTTEVQLDANNNVITTKGRTEVYTSFNMPQAMGAPGTGLGFAYDPEHQRVKQIAPAATTIYLHPDNSGGLSYEKDLKADGSTEHKLFIPAGGQVIALVKQIGTTTTILYFHRDQLGSTTAITNEAGAVIERLAYEAFGKRRFTTGVTDPNNTIVGVNTDRGYTNHEHLDELGLIHMNGRIYDPVLGRFMSADPYIQASDNLQSYNRYGYVMNNPLNATDPSGYFSWGGFGSAIAGKVLADMSGVVHLQEKRNFQFVAAQPGQKQVDNYIMTHSWAYAVGQAVATYYGGPEGAAAWSSYYAYQATGSMTAAYKAGAISYATTYAFSYVDAAGWSTPATIVGKGVVGGVSAKLQGGSFSDGFKYAAISAGAHELYQNVVGQEVDPRPGQNVATGINIPCGESGSNCYKFENGQIPSSFGTANIVGLNERLTGNFWDDIDKQGGLISRMTNAIPFINAAGRFHDILFGPNYGLTPYFNVVTNWGTMLPAGVLTVSAFLDGSPAVSYSTARTRR
jgi:RHS repeat-associated protein